MTLLDAITPGILRRLLRQQLYLALLLVVAVWFIFSVRDVLPIFLFSFILAYLLGPLVRRVAGPEGKGLSRGTAALVVYLLVIALLAVLLYVGYQALRDEVGAYIRSFPAYRLQLLDNLRQQEHNGLLRGLPQSAKDSVNNFVLNFNAVVSDTARRTLPGLVRSVPHLIELIAVPIVAYYLLVDYRRFIDYVGHAMAPTGRGRFDALVADLNNSLRGYLAGQLTLSLIAGAAAFLILAVNGVRPALAVGIAAVILELIPVVGPLAWALTAILLTAVQQPSHLIIVTVLALLAHQADMHILAPRILGGHLRLHPAVVIFALLAGNALLGILGVLLAAPVAATVNIALTYLITEGALSTAAVTVDDDIPLPSTMLDAPIQSGVGIPATRDGQTVTPTATPTPSAPAPASTTHTTGQRQA